jgi:hypothetical protein
MNKKDKQVLAFFNKSQEEYKKTNPVLNIADGAIYGAGLGFVAPGLVSMAAPEQFENAIKNKKIFGNDVAQQAIDQDYDALLRQKEAELAKQANLGKKVSKIDYDNASKSALEEAKGFVKKPMNTNLIIQSGLGRWGAAIGAGVVGVNMARKKLSNKENN